AAEVVVSFSFPPNHGTLVPLAGDWNGDGWDSLGVMENGGVTRLRNLLNDGTIDYQYNFGNPLGVAGDWDG
ncbi:MAG TPA: hypothetical protein VGG20_07255, partial [Thermoanaerobaculia bacterium]